MTTVKVNQSALKQLRQHVAQGVDEAGQFLAAQIKEKIKVQGPPRSSPGNPPHKDTGDLYDSYDHSTDPRNLTSHVGSTAPYAAYLEEGTNEMAPRPHVIPTLIENADDIATKIVG